MTYKQCVLIQETPTGVLTQTAWIPSELAVVNKKVILKNDPKFWMVAFVGNKEVEWCEVNERGQDYKKQRKASDI